MFPSSFSPELSTPSSTAGLAPGNPDALYRRAVEDLQADDARHCGRFILACGTGTTLRSSTPRTTAGSDASMRVVPLPRGAPTGPPSRRGPSTPGGHEPEFDDDEPRGPTSLTALQS